MYKGPIFLKPIFQERIWGGQKLKEEFNYDIPFKHTGEAWVISAHQNGPSIIKNGPLAGESLADAWKNHGYLFNKSSETDEEYPLLVKILDANQDLSVQVHPNDQFARSVEGQPYGKTECWYVLSAEEGAEIVLGHHAKTNKELEDKMDHEEWSRLLKRVKVKAGDFIYVPSGTIHAIGKGIVILETQQSSDITYRVYDYDRTDSNGNKRELHIERSKQVTTVPHKPAETKPVVQNIAGLTNTQLVKAPYFTIYHWNLNGVITNVLDTDFLQVSVIKGSGEITVENQTYPFKKGSHFILPHSIKEYHLSGHAELILSHT